MRRSRLISICCLMLVLCSPLMLRAQQATPPPNIVYVAPGDSLALIAQRNGTTVSALLAANPSITNPDLVFVGQAIIIPSRGAPAATATATGSRPVATLTGTQTITPTPSITPTLTWTLPPTATATGTRTPIPPNTPTIPAQGGTVNTLVPAVESDLPFELGGQVFSFARPDAMGDAGMTWARAQIRWSLGDSIDAARGAIDAARQSGFKILLNVVGNPAQLAGDPATYYQNFGTFLAQVAALNPDAIEVWRAPNTAREWLPGLISPAAYTQLLTVAYNAIKTANVNVIVISAAPAVTNIYSGCTPTGCDDALFIQGMAAAGVDAVADCIGVGYVDGYVPPDATTGDIRTASHGRYFVSTFNVYALTFPNKPLCLTEIGYLSGEGYDPLPPFYAWAANTSVDDQAAWLADAAALARDSGRVRLFMVWNIDSNLYGTDPLAGWAIVRPDGSCAACDALGAVMGG